MINTVLQKVSSERRHPLSHLPNRKPIEYRRNQIIYDERHPGIGLSLILQGRVKITTVIEDGSETVVALLGMDDFFGEAALLGSHAIHSGQATALERTTIMSWTTDEIEAQIERDPALGLALMQVVVRRCVELTERMQSLALEKAPSRVARALLHFGASGTPQPDGTIRIPPLTHQLVAGYVGTSREIVTCQMNHWRSQGLMRYSRRGIELFPEALSQELQT